MRNTRQPVGVASARDTSSLFSDERPFVLPPQPGEYVSVTGLYRVLVDRIPFRHVKIEPRGGRLRVVFRPTLYERALLTRK
jgi:hypothetical protein